MNVHSGATRSTYIAFCCAKLAQTKNTYLHSRAKIRRGIGKESRTRDRFGSLNRNVMLSTAPIDCHDN
jgi:hypothetical protein